MGILRREAIKGLAGAGALAVSGIKGARRLDGADTTVATDIVSFGPEIEPLVRTIEDTPRERCIEVLASRIRSGLSYRQFLAALFLAGIRNVNPQPPGFKLHCVFMLHSAHELSLDAPESERLLPLFWALDNFKQAQAQDVEEGDFHLREVAGPLPSASEAWNEFRASMETWDAPRADRAITALARSRGAHEVMEGLWRYGARDYRNIGHKAIFTANTWRTLQTIGWRHAEPALRSLTLGLVDFGTERRMNGYGFDDQCHHANSSLAAKTIAELPASWTARRNGDANAAKEVLAAVRERRAVLAGAAVARMLAKKNIGAPEAWEAVHLAAGELMMRLPGILGVHCVTSANALHYAYRMSSDAETRLYLLLQGVGWMAQFADFMSGESDFRDFDISEMEGEEIEERDANAVAEVLKLLHADTDQAARKAYSLANSPAASTEFTRAARSLLFRKADEVHDFKFAAAIFEDMAVVGENWRPHMLATAAHYLRGTGHPDSKVVERARDALRMA